MNNINQFNYNNKNKLNLFQYSLIRKKIKYENLYRENFKFINPEKNNELNIFINLMPTLRLFQSDYCREEIEIMKNKDKRVLCSELINLCAHYRHYYWSRHHIYTSFYIYYTFDMPLLKNTLNPNYMKDYMDQFRLDNPVYGKVNEVLYENIKLVEMLSDYLPHIYFFNTRTCDTMNIPNLFIPELRESNPHCANLLIDVFDQELDVLKYPYTKVLKNGKFIGRKEIIDYWIKSHKLKNITSDGVNFKLIPLMYSFIGDTKLGLFKYKNRFGLSGGIKLIKSIIDKKLIDDKSNYNIQVIADTIINEEKDTDGTIKRNFLNNYKLISSDFAPHFLSKEVNQSIRERFKDLEDNESLMDINAKYFPNNSLELIELFEGEYRVLNKKIKSKLKY